MIKIVIRNKLIFMKRWSTCKMGKILLVHYCNLLKIYKVVYWKLLKILHWLVSNISLLYDWMHTEFLRCILVHMGCILTYRGANWVHIGVRICCLEKSVNVFKYVCLWLYEILVNHWKVRYCGISSGVC